MIFCSHPDYSPTQEAAILTFKRHILLLFFTVQDLYFRLANAVHGLHVATYIRKGRNWYFICSKLRLSSWNARQCDPNPYVFEIIQILYIKDLTLTLTFMILSEVRRNVLLRTHIFSRNLPVNSITYTFLHE